MTWYGLGVKVALFISLSTLGTSVLAQNTQVGTDDILDGMIDAIAEQLSEEDRLDENAKEGLAELRELASNPLDINTATEEDLTKLIFLDERKANAIVRHRRRAGGILTPQELMTIRGLSPMDINMLRHIAVINTARDTSTIRRTLKINAIMRAGRRFPLPRGFAETDTTEAAYAGGPISQLFRIKVDVGGRLSLGFVADNDAGEPQLKNGAGLMDYAGGYISYKPARGIVTKAVIGNYSVRLGQGLGIWTGFGFSPTLMGTSASRTATGVSPSMSAAESDYMRGVAMEMRTGRFRSTFFASSVRADVTTQTSAKGETFATTVRTTGYHRTATERGYRHNSQIVTIGGYMSSDIGPARIGIGANNWHTKIPIGYNGQSYRVNMPTGHNLTTISTDIRAVIRRAHIFGEVACQGQNAWGGTVGADFDLGGGNSLSLALRKFGKSYQAQIQQPVCHTSRSGGESGGYIGIETSPLAGLTIRANVDAWRMAWLQSGVWSPTTGWTMRINATYDISRNAALSLRIRHSDKETTTTSTDGYGTDALPYHGAISDSRTTSYKAVFSASPLKTMAISTLCERVHAISADGTHDTGFLIAETMKATMRNGGLILSASASYFDTDSYAARTYTRRPMMLYDMAFATCSGEGLTATGMLTWRISDSLKLWLWATHTKYIDRDEIGTGYEQTRGPRRTDVKVQMQWKLWRTRRVDYFSPVVK